MIQSRSDLYSFGRFGFAALALLLAAQTADAQSLSYREGQNVSPAYEGWELGPDGQRYFLFGYMNRNWEEELDIPVGENNHFTPGPADQGQPTHFLPRRNRFTFRVPVPDGFAETDEMIWTLTAHGVTEKAYASLRPDYFVDNVVVMSETGALGAGTSSPEVRANVAPVIELEGDRVRTARVGQPLQLVAKVTDDGIPRERGSRSAAAGEDSSSEEVADTLSPEQRLFQRAINTPPFRVTVNKTTGLHYAWFVFRGENAVTFDPIQVQTWENTRAHGNSPWSTHWQPPVIPADGRYVVNATFHEPGTYILQGRADDGGLYADERITVHVTE